MKYIIYFMISLIATIIGAITGMGGGIIMKPIFDLLNHYTAFEISIISSTTVFVMSMVSIALNSKVVKQESVHKGKMIVLIVGSVIGGIIGQYIFDFFTSSANDNIVKIVQNAVLSIILLFIIIFLSNANKSKKYQKNTYPMNISLGLVLGIIASFLGIGGGPMNVALIILLLGYSVKGAVICSIYIIAFSQLTKMILIAVNNGFACFNIAILPIIIIAAVIGAFAGKWIGSKMDNRKIQRLFIVTQFLILAICITNIIKNWIILSA